MNPYPAHPPRLPAALRPAAALVIDHRHSTYSTQIHQIVSLMVVSAADFYAKPTSDENKAKQPR